MRYEESHLSDQDLAQAADGELAAARLAKVRAHLAACWPCRARMNEIEAAMISLVRLQREVLDARLPPIAGPRALLRARLAEAGDTIEGSTARGSFGSIFPRLPQPNRHSPLRDRTCLERPCSTGLRLHSTKRRSL